MVKYKKGDEEMALINCPECGKEISDKATTCIHCGFPLNNIVENHTLQDVCIIDGTPFNLSGIKQKVNQFYSKHPDPTIIEESDLGLLLNREIRQLTGINDVAGATLASKIISSKSIPETFESIKYPDPISFDKSKLCCPKCGSTAITTGARGVNWTLGLIGASKTVNRCGKCGYIFKPHQ